VAGLKKIHETREGWLQAAVRLLDEQFIRPSKEGLKLPKRLLVTCGFPRGNVNKVIGMHWGGDFAMDGSTAHIAISPVLDKPLRVLDVLLHELIHASHKECQGSKAHGKKFRAVMKEFGLGGKPTATVCEPGSELEGRLKALIQTLGLYPHVAIKPREKGTGKGGGGWVRLVSVNEDSFKVVVSPKALEEHGLPKDPWGDEMVPANDAARVAVAACER
jgi:hypothetical protein